MVNPASTQDTLEGYFVHYQAEKRQQISPNMINVSARVKDLVKWHALQDVQFDSQYQPEDGAPSVVSAYMTREKMNEVSQLSFVDHIEQQGNNHWHCMAMFMGYEVLAKVNDIEQWEELKETQTFSREKDESDSSWYVKARIDVNLIETICSKSFVLAMEFLEEIYYHHGDATRSWTPLRTL